MSDLFDFKPKPDNDGVESGEVEAHNMLPVPPPEPEPETATGGNPKEVTKDSPLEEIHEEIRRLSKTKGGVDLTWAALHFGIPILDPDLIFKE